jgi:hypothetical protein
MRQPVGRNRENDAFDDAMLLLPKDTVLCTSDVRLKRRVDRSKSHDAWRVMLPEEMLEWLEASPVPFGPLELSK